MNQNYGINPFEYAKNKISESSHKLYQYIIWTTIIGMILAVIAIVTFFVLLIPLGFSIESFDVNDLYATGEAILESGILATGIIAIVFLGIAVFALFIIMILSYVQYYKLGSAFSKLNVADPINEASKYISYGFYGYIIAIVAGIFIPGTAGVIVSILGNVSLAVAAYFIYQLFGEYKKQGRFNAKPSYYLMLGLGLNVVTSITTLFTEWGSLVSLVGFILMLMGFRDLSKDMKNVAPPGGKVPQKAVQQEGPAKAEYVPSEVTKSESSCPNCGANLLANAKFCTNCGANI